MKHLLDIESSLKKRVIGQSVACESVAKAILRGELGPLRADNKPKGSFLLLGPTGVGKTSLVLSLLNLLYKNNKGNFARLDMAEFQNPNALVSLLGENKTTQGRLGDIIDQINENNGGIILFDEIEKAHKDVVKILLSILDEGYITMSTSEKKCIKNTYLFFTSNLGCSKIINASQLPESGINKIVKSAAQDFFGPELLARFKQHIVFSPLSLRDQIAVLRQAIKAELLLWEKSLNLNIQIDEESIIPVIMQSIPSKKLGARPFLNKAEEMLGDALVQFKLSNIKKNILIKAENNRIICLPV